MLRRMLLPAVLLTALALPAGAQAVTVGISDQGSLTFSDPLFKPLHMTVARYITPYDVVNDPAQTAKLQGWLATATAAKQKILISFEHSRLSKAAAGKLPSVAGYTTDIKKFKGLYGNLVSDISAWNEVNRKFDPNRGEGQPTWNNPKRAAQFYMAARKVFTGKNIVALDVLDQASVTSGAGAAVPYIKKFLKYAKPKPKIWGFHPYSDINRFSTKRTKALLKATKSGQVWLTEAGGLVHLGTSFPISTSRAAKADKCMFTIAKSSSRIKRLYVYQFFGAQPTDSFDGGLVNPDNTIRPGYTVVQKRQSGPCKK